MIERSRKLPEGAIDMGKKCSRLLKEQEERSRKTEEKEKLGKLGEYYKWECEQRSNSRKAAGEKKSLNLISDNSTSAALEKPLLDLWYDYLQIQVERDAGDLFEDSKFYWEGDVVAAVRKHKARKWSAYTRKIFTCLNCNKDVCFLCFPEQICRDCTIEQDCGKVD